MGPGRARRHEVRIGPECEAGVVMTEVLRQRLDALAGIEQHRGVVMPKRVGAVLASRVGDARRRSEIWSSQELGKPNRRNTLTVGYIKPVSSPVCDATPTGPHPYPRWADASLNLSCGHSIRIRSNRIDFG